MLNSISNNENEFNNIDILEKRDDLFEELKNKEISHIDKLLA